MSNDHSSTNFVVATASNGIPLLLQKLLPYVKPFLVKIVLLQKKGYRFWQQRLGISYKWVLHWLEIGGSTGMGANDRSCSIKTPVDVRTHCHCRTSLPYACECARYSISVCSHQTSYFGQSYKPIDFCKTEIVGTKQMTELTRQRSETECCELYANLAEFGMVLVAFAHFSWILA